VKHQHEPSRGHPSRAGAMALVSALLLGASTPISKALLDSVEPFTLAGILYLGAAAGLLPVLLWRRQGAGAAPGPSRRLGQLGRRNLLRLGGAILFGGVLGPLLLLFGLRLAPASTVALWLNLETVATAFLAVLLFRENLSWQGWLANLGVFLAGVLMSVESPQIALGGLLVALACVCWGLDNNLTATIDGLSPTVSTFCKGLAAGTVNLLLGLAMTGGELPGSSVLGLGLLTGALSYGASIVLYISAAQQMGATRSQMLFATAPFWGALGAFLFLSESVTALPAAAAVLMLASLIVLFRDRHEHEHEHAALEHIHAHDHTDPHHSHEHPELESGTVHTHWHRHEPIVHTHPHWPDLHHRHEH
jgi:drug/metabolite transporter (DMT)-like permease